MERHFENKISLEWNHEGSFSATIVNGVVTELAFCEPGTGCEKGLTSTDIKFLKSVHQSLGELFKEVEAAQKELGHAYASEG